MATKKATTTTKTWVDEFKLARKRATPIIAIETADPGATLRRLREELNGDTPMVRWEFSHGLQPVNDAGEDAIGETTRDTLGQPIEAIMAAGDMPKGTILFLMFGDKWMEKQEDVDAASALWSMRDTLKGDRRQIVIVTDDVAALSLVKRDMYLIREAMPTRDELKAVVTRQDEAACKKVEGRRSLRPAELERAALGVQGLSPFKAEQAVSMALLEGGGLDWDVLFSQKRAMVRQTKGLEYCDTSMAYSSVGGLDGIKEYFRMLFNGKRPPKVIVWIEEIEKTGLGGSGQGDTSGTNQATHGELLTFMQEQKVYGSLLVGVAGTGKSAMVEAIAGEHEVALIRLNVEATKGSLVGQSGAQLREALKVIAAFAGQEMMFLGTSNSIAGLSGALKSRFVDTWFFDLPDRPQLDAIWPVCMKRHDVKGDASKVDDTLWVGRNIDNCCDKASRVDQPIEDIARYMIPGGKQQEAEIVSLRREAHGKYLDAITGKMYKSPSVAKGAKERDVSFVA